MNQDPPPLPPLSSSSAVDDAENWEAASSFLTALLRAAAVVFLLFGIRDLGGIPLLSLAMSVGTGTRDVNEDMLGRSIAAVSVGTVLYLAGTVVVWKLAPKIACQVRVRRRASGAADSLSANETFLFLAGIFALLWAVAQFIRVFCPPSAFVMAQRDVVLQSVGAALLTPTVVFLVGLWLALGSHRIHAWLVRRSAGRK